MVYDKERIANYVLWILDAIEKIHFHTQGNEQKFIDNPTAIDASILQLIHIGETMNRILKLDESFSLQDIDLKRVICFRNIAAHDYLGINVGVVKRIIFHDLPQLKKRLKEKIKNKK